ncbi:uncharacterized protein LOC101740379 isoform X1 [Bombyx mori]|uniref:DUF4776 domain-containing protein n=1 Tax=Bombyx mori TaxID=7091 RepID=A0A8R2HND9_BOMMO|nr:uncharacterized protein LOC101740379 isoform X1 [Bombyx mori]
MTFSDSMFLFEITANSFKTGSSDKEFLLKVKFADVFTIDLSSIHSSNKGRRKKTRKSKVCHESDESLPIDENKQLYQSILFPMNIRLLMKTIKLNPICILIYKKENSTQLFGETKIPWDPMTYDYLSKLLHGDNPESVQFSADCYGPSNHSAECIVIFKVNIRLALVNDNTCNILNASVGSKTSFIKKPLINDFKNDTINTAFNSKHLNYAHKSGRRSLINKSKDNFNEVKNLDRSSSNILNKSSNFERNDEPIESVCTENNSNESELVNERQIDLLNYILGEDNGPKKNQVYSVNYFTVDSNRPSLSEEKIGLLNITKCDNPQCEKTNSEKNNCKPDHGIRLDLSDLQKGCCNIIETVDEISGKINANLTDKGPCFCSCECTFGFTRKTTYCTTCGGYENTGEDLHKGQEIFPCPIFHKLVDKNKLKTLSTSGSESKKKDDSQRSGKGSKSAASDKRSAAPDKSVESERDTKKGKKKNKDDRFKFNYGYQGIPPQIGHSQCALPCTGTLGVVPKNMGWLWTADNVPGLKFRPMWKPGATNKHVVRLLRIARNPDDVLTKKKKKDTGKKKRPLKRPLLVVQKKDGEYTVTMETMKTYAKPRAVNQVPYEEKPLVTYTIGRTDEENKQRQKRKEREQRRLERAQRQFVQSAFKDVCREICLKTYQQALGILPDAESPDCPCFPAITDEVKANIDASCSCSADSSTMASETDSDEWLIEFTPPVAYYDSGYKKKKVLKVDNTTQYTYLDYRVKLLDRYGNPVPRFFKGPDGKQQCSDLGGFWSPDHKWLDINIDGYVAPDGRWAPNNFIGPNNEQVDCETGKFQMVNGKWLVVGIDGFIDPQGKWRFYKKSRNITSLKKSRKGDKSGIKPTYKPSEASWSCFGDASPKDLSKMGILGHGQDKKLLLSTLKDMLAHGDDVKIPQPFVIPKSPLSSKRKDNNEQRVANNVYTSLLEKVKCKHPVPSDKGVVAMDEFGNKTYFRLKDFKNTRPEQRLDTLKGQGISLSSFHVPCFHSFINSELMKQQQIEKLLALSANSKCANTQAG